MVQLAKLSLERSELGLYCAEGVWLTQVREIVDQNVSFAVLCREPERHSEHDREAAMGALLEPFHAKVMQLPPSKKTRALLAYLALGARPYRREHLCELLWELPDDPRARPADSPA